MHAKKKGNAGGNRFANWLRAHGIKAWRDSASGAGTWEQADVGNNIDIHFEVKTVKKLNLQDAWRQSLKTAGLHTMPYVVVHFDGFAPDKWLVVLDNHDWLELWQKAQEPKTKEALTGSCELRYKTQSAINT